MRYKIVLQKSEEGYSVSCPGLPGCWSQGTTEAEALENIQEAIREYLAAVEDLLQETPDAEVRAVDVTV
jgi:predicted RNase H-like HicB family nuclease